MAWSGKIADPTAPCETAVVVRSVNCEIRIFGGGIVVEAKESTTDVEAVRRTLGDKICAAGGGISKKLRATTARPIAGRTLGRIGDISGSRRGRLLQIKQSRTTAQLWSHSEILSYRR